MYFYTNLVGTLAKKQVLSVHFYVNLVGTLPSLRQPLNLALVQCSWSVHCCLDSAGVGQGAGTRMRRSTSSVQGPELTRSICGRIGVVMHIRSMRVATRHCSLAFLLLTVAVLPVTNVGAEIIIPPPGLNTGDQYRLLFLSSGTRDATSGDIEDYNAFVQQHADASLALAALGVNWKAVVSTPTVAARDNTGTNPEIVGEGFPIYRVDGERVDLSYRALWNNDMTGNLNITEFGEPFPFDPRSNGVENWSGSLPDGTIANTEPFMSLGSERPVTGNATKGGHLVWTNSSDAADSPYHIIGMSDLLTVPVPEPACHFSWLLLLIIRRRRVR